MSKKIIIINGVMGIIGSHLFSYFAESDENIIYGISRQGLYFEKYLDAEGKLPKSTIIFSLTDYYSDNSTITINTFIESIPSGLPIIFIHIMGKFVVEMDKSGNVVIENDYDNDGINDDVKRLTYEIPLIFAKELCTRKFPVLFAQIGSLADKHNIEIHSSWVKSMKLLKNDLCILSDKYNQFNSLILNVSTLLTPKELIDRPLVSIQTNANIKYWLPPVEVAKFIDEYNKSSNRGGCYEEDLYRTWPSFSQEHFSLEHYKERKKLELYNNRIQTYGNVLNISDGDSISYNFSNPFHMDRFWGDLTLFLFSQHKKYQPIVFYNPHSWFFIVRNKTEDEMFSIIHNEGGLVLLICGSDTKLDRDTLEKEFKKYRHKYRIAANLNFENNYNLNIYGDFIIEAIFDTIISNKIDEFYTKYSDITQENIKELKDIVSMKGKNQLIISRDKQKSENLRKELAKDFKIPAPYEI